MENIHSQNIHLSNNIGRINENYTYGRLKKALGKADSVFTYDPKRLSPRPKNLAYNRFYYDKNKFIVSFYYFMLDTLTEKENSPSVEIYNGSTIKLNGDYISDLDSSYVIKKYGKPKSINKGNDEFTISYTFERKRYFSLLTFYFNPNGIVQKVWMNFGKYLK